MSQLPPGIKRIESGRDLNNNPVVRVELEAPLIAEGIVEYLGPITIIGSPREMRAFFALGLRQCDLTEANARGEAA